LDENCYKVCVQKVSLEKPEISIVIPVFNEEKRIAKSLSRLASYLRRRKLDSEVIVVDDGSNDKTEKILNDLAQGNRLLRVVRHEKNKGKGFAVQKGVQLAKGKLIFFTDADLSTPPQEIKRFIEIFNEHPYDGLIGSRNTPGARLKIKQPCYRQNMGRVFNWFVRKMTPLDFKDTQCGFKAFRNHAAKQLFPRLRLEGFAFDVELLMLAREHDFFVKEVPVTWVNSRKSRVSPLTGSLKMFLELRQIQKRFNRRKRRQR